MGNKNDSLIRLLEEWLADESGYDEETWPAVKRSVEENRLSCRKRFKWTDGKSEEEIGKRQK